MLKIDNLHVRQDDWTLDYNLQVTEGEILAIQGRSGVGKSTLLYAIAGFVPVGRGIISWRDQPLNPLPPEQRPVSLLFQDHNLFEHLSVEQNLQLGFSGEVPRSAIRDAAEQLEVAHLLASAPGNCSGGQRQRIALIRTLLRPEPIVLLDEAFAELDSHTRELATGWTRQVAREGGKTLLLVTHQDEDVHRVADRALILQPENNATGRQ